MIRARSTSDEGPVLLLGLSAGNLDLLQQGEPIAFPLPPLGFAGLFLIVFGDESAKEATRAEVQAIDSSVPLGVVNLDEADYTRLRQGDVLSWPLTDLGLPDEGRAAIFGGVGTEPEMLAGLRTAGLITPELDADLEHSLAEWWAHELGLVPGCEKCAARIAHEHTPNPAAADPMSDALADYSPRPPPPLKPIGTPGWRGWVEEHPTTAALAVTVAVIALCTAIGLAIEAL